MSFVKSVKCFFCEQLYSIQEANIPENLFDLVFSYHYDNLFWLCDTCKKVWDQNPSSLVPHLLNKNKEINGPFLNTSCKNFSDGDKMNLNSTVSLDHQHGDISQILAISDDKVESDSGSETASICSLNRLSLSTNPKDGKSIQYAQQILGMIKIDPKEEKTSNSIVQLVLQVLLSKLQENKEFSCMYNRPVYTGSAYNNLRITAATEYDIDLVLKVPKAINLTPEFDSKTYSFAKLKWEAVKEIESSNLVVEFLKSNSVDCYLQPRKVLSWFQRNLDLIKDQLILPTHVLSLKYMESGPARTIIIQTDLEYSISVDLVPVFEFEYFALHGTSILPEIMKTAERNNNDRWLLVPKETKGEIDVVQSQAILYWRLDFPNTEKRILSGKQCANSVIRILKIFRDKNDWKSLASYYLKMVVILEIIKCPEKWDNGYLYQRLMDSLKSLEKYLEKKNLPHFLTQQNLLFKLKNDHCTNWRNRLHNLISDFESNPEALKRILN